MKAEGARGAGRNVRFEDGAGQHFADHGGAALLHGLQSALQDVARAEAGRFFERQENIACANGNADSVARLSMTEGNLDCRC